MYILISDYVMLFKQYEQLCLTFFLTLLTLNISFCLIYFLFEESSDMYIPGRGGVNLV